MSLLGPLSLNLFRRRVARGRAPNLPRGAALQRLSEHVRALDAREARRSERVIERLSALEGAITALAHEASGLASCVAEVAQILGGEADEGQAIAIEPEVPTLAVGELLAVKLRGGLPSWARVAHWQAQGDGTAFEIDAATPDSAVLRGVTTGRRTLLVILEPKDTTAAWPSEVFTVGVTGAA